MRIWHRNIDGVHAFYMNGLLRSLYMSLTTIFVPIFIYLRGMLFFDNYQKALLVVVLFFIIQRVIIAVIVFPLSKIIEKLGFRKSIALSALFLIGYTVALLLTPINIGWLWVSAVCGGLQIPLYWISRDSALSQDVHNKEMGQGMSTIAVFENIASFLGPFVGGTIVVFAGYPVLFVVALSVLVLSILPLWWMPSHTHKNGVSLAGFWQFLTNGRYTHQAIANFGSAMNDYGNGVIWPLILFLSGITNNTLGAIYSIVAVVAIAIEYLTGKWFDHLRAKQDYSDEGVFGFASVGVALSWGFRLFVTGIFQILSLDIARQLFGTIYSNFFADYIHLGGKRMGSIAFWVYQEVVYSIGSIVLFGLMAIGIYFGVWKELTLITISLWSLGSIVMARESNLK